MSAPDSRKAFLTKITLGLLAVGSVPSLLWRRTAAPAGAAGAAPQTPVALKPDPRAVARVSAEG